MAERIALDCSRYASLKPYTRENVVAEDLAALFVEAKDTEEIEERIWPYRFECRVGEKVVCPEMGNKDITEYFSNETELEQQETVAGEKLKDALINESVGTTVVWLSPPNDEYSEGRITLGRIVWQNNIKVMQCFGLPVDFSQKTFLRLAERLSGPERLYIENLRSHIFVLSKKDGQTSWQRVKEKLPLGQIWSVIENKQAEVTKRKILRDARLVVGSAPVDLWSAKSVRVGAYLERGMERIGHRIDTVKSGCGGLNKDLTSMSPQRVLNSPHGVVRKEGGEKSVYVESCGKCGKHIGKYMTPGKSHCPHCGALFPKLC